MSDPSQFTDHTHLYFVKHSNLFIFNKIYINTIQISEKVTTVGMHREAVTARQKPHVQPFLRLF
jgi:hypothetical protein